MMGHFGRHMGGQMGHHGGCGCQMCGGHRECKKKMFMALVFFGVMAIANMFIVGMLHLMLHAKEVFRE